jgi:hypothetical protein
MTDASLTSAQVQKNLSTLSAAASAFLLALAGGKYDSEVAVTEQILKDLAVALPPAGEIEKALEVFLWLNKVTAPSAVVPDGKGGFVPAGNSHYDPKTGKFVPKS